MHSPTIPTNASSHATGDEIGHVISVSGSSGTIALKAGADGKMPSRASCPSVGQLIKIIAGDSTLLGLVSGIASGSADSPGMMATGTARIELVGEIIGNETGDGLRFRRGVSNYPKLGDRAFELTSDEVVAVYINSPGSSASIGTLMPETSAQACINIETVGTRHFAVLGSTGTGKTCAVSIILNKIVERVDEARVFIIDPHDEYRHGFEGKAEIINPQSTILPFWLFNFEEIVDVFFKARPGIDSEVEILRDLIPAAKRLYARNNRPDGADVIASTRSEAAYSVDTPVPYRLSDLIKMIDNRMGSLDQRENMASYKRLKARIESVSLDPRYGFMFNQRTIEDTMSEVIARLFRIPTDGKPVTIVELAGFPTEVVDALVSVLCRLAFDFNVWSNGAVPLVVVCEEAHRYVPAAKSLGFGPTRRAVSRLAKEGRKYRLSLCLVSQRPAELDPTILSQCTTVFAMRMANESDQAIIRAAVMDSAAGLLACLPSIGEREAVAFGDAVSLPMRMRFAQIPRSAQPSRLDQRRAAMIESAGSERDLVDVVVANWRAASTRQPIGASRGSGGGADFAAAPQRPFFDQYADGDLKPAAPPAAPPVHREISAEPPPSDARRKLAVDWKALREKAKATP